MNTIFFIREFFSFASPSRGSGTIDNTECVKQTGFRNVGTESSRTNARDDGQRAWRGGRGRARGVRLPDAQTERSVAKEV